MAKLSQGTRDTVVLLIVLLLGALLLDRLSPPRPESAPPYAPPPVIEVQRPAPKPETEPEIPEECPEGCTVPPPECDIKGNISLKTGERIYHVPGQAFYDKTKIAPEYGEMWFCTEEEAEDNGWRKAKR